MNRPLDQVIMKLSKCLQAFRQSQACTKIEDEECKPLLAEQMKSKPRLKYTILPTSIPQLDWTNEECVDWLTQLIKADFKVMEYSPLEYTRKFTGDGMTLWTTTEREWMQNIDILHGRRIFTRLEYLIHTKQKNVDDLQGLNIPALKRLGGTFSGSLPGAVEPAKKERWWRMSHIPPAGIIWDDLSTMQLVNTVIFHRAWCEWDHYCCLIHSTLNRIRLYVSLQIPLKSFCKIQQQLDGAYSCPSIAWKKSFWRSTRNQIIQFLVSYTTQDYKEWISCVNNCKSYRWCS